jgi:hypothetical protein
MGMGKFPQKVLMTVLLCGVLSILCGVLLRTNAKTSILSLPDVAGDYSAFAAEEPAPFEPYEPLIPTAANNEPDSTQNSGEKPRFPVSNLSVVEYDDLSDVHAMDLKNPSNVTTEVEFDCRSGTYVVRTKVGDLEINTPMVLSADEYKRLSLQQEMQKYWNAKKC